MSSTTKYTPSIASSATLVDFHESSAWCFGGWTGPSKSLSRVTDKCKLATIVPAIWVGWSVLDLLKFLCVGAHSERTTRQAWRVFFMALDRVGLEVVLDALTRLPESDARLFVAQLITRGESGWLTRTSWDDESLSPTDSAGQNHKQSSSMVASTLWLLVALLERQHRLIEGVLTPARLSKIIQANDPTALVAPYAPSLAPFFASLASFNPLEGHPEAVPTQTSIKFLNGQQGANPNIRCMCAILNLRSGPARDLEEVVGHVIRYLCPTIGGNLKTDIISDHGPAINNYTSLVLPFLYFAVALLSTFESRNNVSRPFSKSEAFINTVRLVCESDEYRQWIFPQWGLVRPLERDTAMRLCRMILHFVLPSSSS